MAVNVTLKWTPGLKEVERALGIFGARLADEVRNGTLAIGRLAADQLKESTPRSNPLDLAPVLDSVDAIFGQPTDHVADGWESIKESERRGSELMVSVQNKNPRWDGPIQLANGGVTSLGEIIEFGSRPHVIRPKNKKALAFMAGGSFIVTKGPVYHPGTQPTAVVAIASAVAGRRGSALMDAAARTVREFRMRL